ncbi:MAG: acyl-CoA dehydrogenase family protein [Kofleriaceae bacterium]
MTHPLSPPDIVDEVARSYAPWITACVNPGAKDRDRHAKPIDRDLMSEAGMLGLLGFTMPTELGGEGRSWRDWGFVLHEIGYHTDDTALPMLLAYCGTVTRMLYDTGRADIIDRYVRTMVGGHLLGGFAWSEGNDPFAFQTTLRKTATGYELCGFKGPIANGLIADVVMVFARSVETDDVVTVLVERADRGVEIQAMPATGLRAAGMASWSFDRVELPADRLIVESDGISWGQRFLNERRLEMPCWALGRMRRLFEACVSDLSTRIRFGRPATEMQTIQAAVGKLVIALETSRAVLRGALDRVGTGGGDFLWEPQLAVVKSHVIEQALLIVRIIQDITGGYAVLESHAYERTCRDLQCLNPIAGTLATLHVDLGVLAIEEIALSRHHQRRTSQTNADQAIGEPAAIRELPRRTRR